MCGIVGYIGPNNAQDILLQGLRRLEYRGYDSSGLSIWNDGVITTIKTSGKLDRLEDKLATNPLTGNMGIGHTRWATHGHPTDTNAHPHTSSDGNFVVVHNGIIENYNSLREKLKTEGIQFKTDTDTEVIAQLLQKFYNGNLCQTVLEVMALLRGTFGIATMCAQEENVLVGARRGSPLVIGLADDQHFLASDASALVDHTQKVIYLGENEAVCFSKGQYHICSSTAAFVEHEIQELEMNFDAIQKNGFTHFMLKEIMEQPQSLENTMRGRILLDSGTSRLDGLNLVHQELRRIRRVILTACGTSYYAAKVGEYVIENLAGIPVEVEYASEFRYRNPIIDDKTLVFAISQSGETADTLAAIREAKHKGAMVLGICNVVGSSIARETHGGVYLHAGPEIGVASTKAFTSQVAVLTMIGLLLGRMRRLSVDEGIKICQELALIPQKIDEILKLNDLIQNIASEFHNASNFLYLGRGYNYPVALEGALKMKEISYVHAEGYPAAEMKHGPIALIDENMPTIVLAPSDSLFEKTMSNIQEIKARGGKIVVIATESSSELENVTEHVIIIPKTMDILSPLLTVIPLQLLAYHVAVLRGCDVDRPRNLAKSVTVE